jgi:hypothetical protein
LLITGNILHFLHFLHLLNFLRCKKCKKCRIKSAKDNIIVKSTVKWAEKGAPDQLLEGGTDTRTDT